MSKVDVEGAEVEMKSKDQILYEQIIEDCKRLDENLEKQKKINDMMKRGAKELLEECT